MTVPPSYTGERYRSFTVAKELKKYFRQSPCPQEEALTLTSYLYRDAARNFTSSTELILGLFFFFFLRNIERKVRVTTASLRLARRNTSGHSLKRPLSAHRPLPQWR